MQRHRMKQKRTNKIAHKHILYKEEDWLRTTTKKSYKRVCCVVYYKIFTTDINLICTHVDSHSYGHSQKKECDIISLAQRRFLYMDCVRSMCATMTLVYKYMLSSVHLGRKSTTFWSFYQIDSGTGLQYHFICSDSVTQCIWKFPKLIQ